MFYSHHPHADSCCLLFELFCILWSLWESFEGNHIRLNRWGKAIVISFQSDTETEYSIPMMTNIDETNY